MKCPIGYSKQEILDASRQGGANLQKVINGVLQDLCRCDAFERTVKSWVRTRGGNTEDAEDLIQESLSQLALNLLDNKYQGGSSIENYAFGICKFKWLNIASKKGISTVGITDDDKEKVGTDDVEGSFVAGEMREWLWKIVGSMRGRCPDFLKLWAMGYSHREIGSELEVTEKRARKNTSECRKRLRESIAADTNLMQFMQEMKLTNLNLF